MRPSGKMISVSPALTALMSVRVAIGLVGSSGMARVSLRNGLTHQRWAMPWSMANTGSCSRNESASAGVEEAHVVERDDRVRAGLGDILEAVHFEAIEDAQQDGQEIAQRCCSAWCVRSRS